MPRYILENNKLTLIVKKANSILMGLFFFMALTTVLGPVIGLGVRLSTGGGFHFGFVIVIAFSGAIGFQLFRYALWNTYGREIITISGNEVNYVADYGWFKDAVKSQSFDPLNYTSRCISYEEDGVGTLVIGNEESEIRCVTKIPLDELEQIIQELESGSFN